MKYNQKTLNGIYRRIVGSMSGMSDVTVKIHPQIVPHWNPNDRTVNMPLTVSYAQNDEEDFTFGRGILVHESSHVLFAPDPDKILDKPADFDEVFSEWFNVFCDCNNEYKVTQLWPHLEAPLANKTRALFKSRPEILKSDNPFMQVLMRCDKVAKLNPEFPENYPDKLKKFVTYAVKQFEEGNIIETDGPTLVRFTDKISKEWKVLQKIKNEEGANGNKEICKLMKELGDLIKSGAGKQEIDEKKAEVQVEREKGKAGWFKDDIDKALLSTARGGGNEDYNKLTLDELKKRLKEAKPDSEGGEPGGWGCSCIEEYEVNSVEPYDYQVEVDRHGAYKTGKKVNRALKRKVKLQEDYEKKQRSGRVDFSEVRRQVGQVGQLMNQNVFQRSNDFTRGGQWAVEVLVDCSGSMNGKKMREAKQAMATLGYALDGIPNVKYALTGFNHLDGVQEITVKKFKDRRLNMDKLEMLGAGGGNCDGLNIREAGKRLLKFRNMKKILVVISDGQPAYIEGIDDVKKKVQVAERFGINVIGIGIEGCCEESLKDMYPTNYMFEDTENLHTELTNLILAALGQRDKIKLVKRVWER